MDTQTFQKFREIVFKHSGINLNETKQAMVSSRIAKRMRVFGLQNPKEYLNYLIKDSGGDEIIHFLDVISTNVTSFFREPEHFVFLSEKLAEQIKGGKKKIRIWCAASSTGEEPYTLAMTLLSAAQGHKIDLKILATDISTRVLAKAQSGIYQEELLSKVPKQLQQRYFKRSMQENNKQCFAAIDEMKKLILFRRLNLSKPPFPMKGQLDFVFCRNVMIYFNNETRNRLVAEIHRLLNPGGYLFTGHAESLTSSTTDLKCIKPSIYQKDSV